MSAGEECPREEHKVLEDGPGVEKLLREADGGKLRAGS